MKRSIAAVLALILVTVLPACACAREVSKEYDESFDVAEGVTLNLRHGDGDVVIAPWDRNVIRVEVVFRAEITAVGFGTDTEFEVEFRQSDNVVDVVGKEPGWVFVGFVSSNYHEYTYTIHAPAYTSLHLYGDDGDVTVDGWRSSIECGLDDGDVRLQDVVCANVEIMIEDGTVRGGGLACDFSLDGDDSDVTLSGCELNPCWISVNDGDVALIDCTGEIGIRADDGDVRLDGVRAARIDVQTSDGDIDVGLVGDESFDLDLSADDGDVAVEIAPGLSADFRIDVGDGRIEVELPELKDFVKDGDRASGVIGGGGGRIRIRTDDGNVSLRES